MPRWFKYLALVFAFVVQNWKFLLMGAVTIIILIARRYYV